MKLLTVAEAAAELHVHPNTVRRLLEREALTKVQVGRAVRVIAGELEAYARGGGDRGAPAPMTDDQRKALFGKAAAIDRALERPVGTAKKRILEAAAKKFEREIDSVTVLTWGEADWILDQLQASCVELGISKP